MLFRDRSEAGQRLGSQLQEYANRNDVTVLALPRGGVPVAFEVARTLRAPLDVFLVRKLGAPGQEELAMGAVATGGVCVVNPDVVRSLGISREQLEAVATQQIKELQRQEQSFRGNRESTDVRGHTVILVDDGLATGSTMRAGVIALRQEQPRQIVVAVPVASRSTCAELQGQADETICLYTPLAFHAVGQWYQDFSPITDDQVHQLLDRAAEWTQRPAA